MDQKCPKRPKTVANVAKIILKLGQLGTKLDKRQPIESLSLPDGGRMFHEMPSKVYATWTD